VKRNPFRSEQDAFRLFVLVGAAALFVVAVALILGGRVAAYVGIVFLLFGLWHMGRWIAEAIQAPEKVGTGEDEPDGGKESR
jgi:hypothetical protein